MAKEYAQSLASLAQVLQKLELFIKPENRVDDFAPEALPPLETIAAAVRAVMRQHQHDIAHVRNPSHRGSSLSIARFQQYFRQIHGTDLQPELLGCDSVLEVVELVSDEAVVIQGAADYYSLTFQFLNANVIKRAVHSG